MKELENIKSVCPACYQEGKINKIDAKVVEEGGKVYITKNCEKHGSFKDIYFSDANLYKRWMRFSVTGNPAPDVKVKVFDEPALYDEHLSQSVLTNLLVTNRCDLRCNYCFMNAGASGRVYEPTLDPNPDGYPLVVGFHGCGAQLKRYSFIGTAFLIPKAKAEKFIVVCPNAYTLFWNAGSG